MPHVAWRCSQGHRALAGTKPASHLAPATPFGVWLFNAHATDKQVQPDGADGVDSSPSIRNVGLHCWTCRTYRTAYYRADRPSMMMMDQ